MITHPDIRWGRCDIKTVGLLPNVLAPVIVAAAFGIPGAIMLEASLSYLGLGIQPPLPSWGGMIADAFDRRSYGQGSGSYGAGLTSAVRRGGHRVVEVNREDRRSRRANGWAARCRRTWS